MQDFLSAFQAALPIYCAAQHYDEFFKGDNAMTAIKNVFEGLAARFTAWRERERAYAELSSLDDHTLADLGLRRSDIPLVVFAMGRERSETQAATAPRPAASNSNNGLRAA
jgi:uncharacterized protein YjiS (DUF1127 family)